MEAKIIAPLDFSLLYNNFNDNSEVIRESYLEEIEEFCSRGHKIVIIDGNEGGGKSTLLMQFAKKNSQNSFVYFINSSCSITYKQDYLLEDMGRQIYFYNKAESPNSDIIFDESLFNNLVFELIKINSRKKKNIYFVIDGLDQIEKNDLELLKNSINSLPWNTNNFTFIISGEPQKIQQLIPKNAFNNVKTIWIPRFSFEETCKYFVVKNDEEKSHLKEIYDIWKGHPEDLSQIKHMIDAGTSLEEFVNNDEIKQKNDLLEASWKNYNIENKFNDINIQLLSILTFNDSIQDIDKLGEITGNDREAIVTNLSKFSFLNIDQNKILFNSKSFRIFLSKKLKSHERKISSLLINYFANRKDYEAVLNLPNLYERNKEWKDIIGILSLDNIGMIINKSKSFSEIKRQINYGYKAAINLNNAYADLLNFTLYKSTVLSLQKSDSKESQIRAYICLGKKDHALSIISSIIIKEDRLKMLIFYAKTCKIKELEIEEIVIGEIKEYIKEVDIDYLNENAEDIILGLAYFLPALAVQAIEKVSGLQSEDNSLEWLVSYTSSIIASSKKGHDDGDIIVEDKDGEISDGNLLEKFTHSIGIGVNKVKSEEIISHIETYDNYSDRLFLLRNWILKNKKSQNIFEIIEYAINLLVHNSSTTKPTTTILLDIISPLKNIKDVSQAEKIIDKVEELMVSINSPTGDKIRIEIKIIEKTIDFNISLANDKLIRLEKFINTLTDYSVKVNAIADLWVLIKKISNDGLHNLDELLLEEKFIKDNLFFTISKLLSTTADHYIILKTTISKVAKYDINLSIEICNLFNTEKRRMDGITKCIEVYTENNISEWDIEIVKKTIESLTIANYYDDAVLTTFNNAFFQKANSKNHLKKIVYILPLIDKVSKNLLKCYIITKAIGLLYLKPNSDENNKLTYKNLIKKLETHLAMFWNRIDIPWQKTDIGYNICSDLAEHNNLLAENYKMQADLVSDEFIIDNVIFAGIYAESIRLSIRLFCAILSKDSNYKYDKIENLINQVPSKIERVQLWSELAARVKLANIKDIAEDIIKKKILPILNFYFEKDNKEDFHNILHSCASAMNLCQPHAFKLYLENVPKDIKEDIVNTVLYTILTRTHESDPYKDKIGHKKFEYQDAKEFIDLLYYLESDNRLFWQIRKLCYIAKHYPNNFPREQRLSLKKQIQELVSSKLPSSKGISHEGYVIAVEACIQYFNISKNDNVNIYEKLGERTKNIPNAADRCFIYAILAEECEIKKKKIEFLENSFSEADKILSIQEKADSYELALKVAKEVSRDIFNTYLKKLQTELFNVDHSEMFPTFRNLIDLAYDVDKSIAQKFITAFDNDPARMHLSKPSNNYFNKLELEKTVKDDYSQINKIRSRKELAITCYTMLGQLNAGKRHARDIDKTIYILKASSKIPFTYSSSMVEFFLQNVIKKESSSNSLLIPFYESTCSNSRLTYELISYLRNKNSNLNSIDNTLNDNSFLSLPNSRDESIEYIASIIKSTGSKEVYIVDPYFSQDDLEFIKLFTEWTYGANYSVLSTCDSKKEFNKFLYENAWNNISSEQPPNITFIKVTGQKISEKDKQSPIHDRWIIMKDKSVGVRLGTSINSIGKNKVSEISLMTKEYIDQKFNSVITPLILNRNREYEDYAIKYESFDL